MPTLNVLMVDDDPEIRLLVRVLLRMEDIEVSEAGSAIQAFDQLETRGFDVVILDWMMPVTSGIDVLRWIRSRDELAGVRVVMLTGISEDRLPEAVEAGADWVVTKPFDVDDLLAALDAVRAPAFAGSATSRSVALPR